MFGLEAVFRNGVPVGHLRRSDYGFFIDKTIGYGYIRNPDGGVVNTHTALTMIPSLLLHPSSYVLCSTVFLHILTLLHCQLEISFTI